MKARDHLILALTIFVAVSAALVGAVEFYRWRVGSAMAEAREQAVRDRELDRRYEKWRAAQE